MNRTLRHFGLVAAFMVISGSALAASSGWTRYTFPAAPPDKVVAPGTMTVKFPEGWHVTTTWKTATASNRWRGSWPNAYYLSGRDAMWWPGLDLVNPSTTISDIRAGLLGWMGNQVWGKGTPLRVYVGDSYLTLPVGKVWRLTQALVPVKGETDYTLHYERDYVLDRGIVTTTTGTQKHLFEQFTVICSAEFCKAHNGQLAAVMRSIRITP